IGSYLFSNLILSLSLYSIIWVITFIFYDARNIDMREVFKGYRIDKIHIKTLLISALPLAFVASINTLYENIPRYFIEYQIGIDALGIFSGLFYITLIGNIFITVLGLIFSTKISEYYSKNYFSKIKKIILFLIVLVGTLSLIIYIFSSYF